MEKIELAGNKHDHPYQDSVDISDGFLPDEERLSSRILEKIKAKVPPKEAVKDLVKSEDGYGYHLRDIPRGEFGEASKIKEETDEFMEALEQDSKLMALIELADLYGAIKGYLKKHHPTISMSDLRTMSKITKRAFENGHRS